jgi:SAM-dependent methyltransferase
MSLTRGTLALSQTCHSGFVSESGGETIAYARFHERRFRFLLDAAGRAVPQAARVLDVGLGPQTALLRERWPEARLDTLGFLEPRFAVASAQHYEYDLTRCADPSGWPPLNSYDLIVFAEVIEHLHVPPHVVLAGLARYLAPEGVLLLQTPNAVAAWKRLEILRGRNPYDHIRETPTDPGHLREYTLAEILDAGRRAGLQAQQWWMENYFGQRGPLRRAVYGLACALAPGPARDGITVAFRRSNTAPAPS